MKKLYYQYWNKKINCWELIEKATKKVVAVHIGYDSMYPIVEIISSLGWMVNRRSAKDY